MGFSTLRFTIDRRDNNQARVWLRGEFAPPRLPPRCYYCGTMKGPTRAESHAPLCFAPDMDPPRWVCFLFLGNEWRDALTHGGEFPDGMHRLRAWGEDWLFYDIPDCMGESGVAPMSWARAKFPRHVRELLVQDIERALDEYDRGGRTQEVRLDYTDCLAEWELDGNGTGRVELHPDTNAATRDMLQRLDAQAHESWVRSWECVQAIARNRTHRRTEVGIVRIFREGPDSLYWSVEGALHGGIINHGTDAEPNWSVHT